MMNIKYLKGWEVGGRKLVLDVCKSWHTMIQGQVSNPQSFLTAIRRIEASPEWMTFQTPEVSEKKFNKSLGRDLGKRFTIPLSICSR